MGPSQKRTEKETKSRAYRQLLKDAKGLADIKVRTASNIFDHLGQAHLNERNADSSLLAREELLRGDPAACVPEELSDKAVARYLASAGELYGEVAIDYLLNSDLPRAFRYLAKASRQYRRASELDPDHDEKLLRQSRAYRENSAAVRHELAKRTLRRRKWSLGLLGRIK
jgi:hypothetical protein